MPSGHRQEMCTPRWLAARRSASVPRLNASAACLLAEYTVSPGAATRPASETTLMT